MGFISTASNKPIMLFLLLATISLVLHSSFHNSMAEARVERELYALPLFRALAYGAARVGRNRLWKASEKVILKVFSTKAKKNSNFNQMFQFIYRMKNIATQQCKNNFCVTSNLRCEPCSSNSPLRFKCDPYCVLHMVGNNTFSCMLPCGPPKDDNGGDSPSPSPSA